VATIGGSSPADVYTNNANYTGSGGNGSTTGTFAGTGANNPQPLTSAPAFDDPPAIVATTSGTLTTNVSSLKTTSGKATGTAINVNSSDQLLSLLDDATAGPDGKITIPASKATSNLKNSSRLNATDRLNAAGRLNAGRRAAEIRDARPLLAARLR
jgi:hypothetical protein